MNPSPSPIWTEFAGPLRAFLGRRAPAGIDAEDLVQDVFVRIHANLGALRDTERVDAWIFRIARNVLTDALRVRQRRAGFTQPLTEEVAAVEEAADEYPAAASELANCLAPMIACLEEPYRQAIELSEVLGLTQAEAATRAGVTLSGMKSRVQRGRQQLKGMLLECCRIDLDCRGGVLDYERREAVAECVRCGPKTAPNETEQ